MWYDSYKISNIERYPLPWDKRDIDIALNSWEIHDYETPWQQNNWQLTLKNAGHIPGAAMLKVESEEKNILFTGDFLIQEIHPLLKVPSPLM